MAKTRGFGKAKKDLDKVADKLEGDMNRIGREGASSMRTSAKQQLSEPNSFGSPTTLTGALLHSLHTTEEHRRHVHEHTLTADAPHAKYVEYGTGKYNLETGAGKSYDSPSFTPRLRKNIKAWIIIRGIKPRNNNMSIDELSWVIAQSIAEHGTRRQAFMTPAYYQNRRTIMRRAKAAVRKRLR